MSVDWNSRSTNGEHTVNTCQNITTDERHAALRSADVPSGKLRAIAYSMDALIPGFYFWFGSVQIRFWGTEAEDSYPGTVHDFAGIALVLPGYRIFSTYQGDHDPR